MTTTAQPLTAQPTVADDLFEARRILDAHTDRVQCSNALDTMRGAATGNYYPFDTAAVAYLLLLQEGPAYRAVPFNKDGRRVGHGFAVPGPPFSTGVVPETFVADPSAPELAHMFKGPVKVNPAMLLDVVKVDAHDFEADARNTQEAVVFSQVQRMWTRGDVESYIVTRDHLADVVREEAQGYQAILSPEEVTAAVDAVLADSRLEDAFAALRDEVYRLAAEQIETLTKGHPNA